MKHKYSEEYKTLKARLVKIKRRDELPDIIQLYERSLIRGTEYLKKQKPKSKGFYIAENEVDRTIERLKDLKKELKNLRGKI